jgi:hypothetical protein
MAFTSCLCTFPEDVVLLIVVGFAQVISSYGRGGAVCILSGLVRLKGCLLHGNYAKMASTDEALDATGGAIAIDEGGVLEMQGTQLWGNKAGGWDSLRP